MATIHVSDAPPQRQQELLLDLFGSLTGDHVREFMRRHKISGLSKKKAELLEAVEEALKQPGLPWASLIAYLDEVELYQKQHVVLMRSIEGTEDQWGEERLKEALVQDGKGQYWEQSIRVAAPDELQYSTINVDGDAFVVHAIGQRTYVHRNENLESGFEAPTPDSEVRVYETVRVRAWARLELDLVSGNALIRCTRMPTRGSQEALVKAFDELISTWFPMTAFQPVDLAETISTLHENEEQTPCEARVQEVSYRTASGLQSVVKASTGGSSISGHGADVDDAVKTLRTSGRAARGVFYFLPPQATSANGASAATSADDASSDDDAGPTSASAGDSPVSSSNPFAKERRVAMRAESGVVDFSKAIPKLELEHALRRIRVLAA